MEYQDLTIDVRSAEGGGFEAAVTESPVKWPRGKRPCAGFVEPVSRGVLDQLLGSFDAPGSEIGKRIEKLAVSPRQMGEAISKGLFHDGLAGHFARCRDLVSKGAKKGLRLRLRFWTNDPQAGYLAALPWEWLWDPLSTELLAHDRLTPMVRGIVGARCDAGLEVEPPVRVLVVDAAPATMKRLKLKLEIERVKKALKSLTRAGLVEVVRLVKVTPDGLRDALLAQEERGEGIHILHFMGHGGYDSASGAGAIFFEKDDGGEDQMDGEELAAFLKRMVSLRLVVLNACKTARHSGGVENVGSPFNHGVASAVLERSGVPAVVANQHSISDGAAIAFSEVFYGRIAAGDGVDEAMTETRLRLWRRRTHEWATPVLFLSAPNGKILTVKPAQRAAQGKTFPVAGLKSDESPVRLGIRSFDGWGRDMEERNDAVLDRVSLFSDRFIKDKSWWQEKIFPDLRAFLDRWVVEGRPLLLDFAAHSSIAFAAGWLLEPKSGLDVGVRQRTGGEGEVEWHPEDGSKAEGTLWLERTDVELDPKAPDVAVALSVSQRDVVDHVKEFVQTKKLPVGRILDATIAPEPGQRSVRGGAHCLRLAQALLPRLQTRFPHERGGRIHIFAAAPNAFTFYLGQLASSLGRVVLYEFAFKAENAFGRYQQSIELPPPGEAPRIPDDW